MNDNKTVEQLLLEHNVPYRFSGKDYVTSCFNPEHTDSNPSFRIDRFTGVAHCFSCGWKMNLFKHYGVSSNNASVKVAKIKEKLRLLSEHTNGLEPLEGSVPLNAVFRNISSQTLKLFGAFKTDKVTGMEDRVIFPIKDGRDKVTAYVGRHVLQTHKVRYQLYPPNCSVGLYPTRFKDRPSTIVLVEGMFDLLNLFDKGVTNVVCTFGVSGLLTNTAEKLLPYKAAGVSKIFILYDGDDPGRESAAKILPLIQEAGFEVENIDLPEGEDPGSLDQQTVNEIREYTK